MNNQRFQLVLPLAFLLASCGGSGSNVSFTGKWSLVKENAISDQKTEQTVDVVVKGDRFKLHAVGDDADVVTVYDGSTLTERTTPLKSAEGEPPLPPTRTSAKKSSMEVAPHRFWQVSYSGDPIAGGQIAGRDTLLYQAQDRRPDGQLTVQTWVDAQTHVVLKRTFMVYSSQIEQLVSRSTEECREISYAPVDDGVFEKSE